MNIELNQMNRVKYFCLAGDFNSELLERFFDLLNSTDSLDIIEISMSSCGGDISPLFTMLYLINSNPEKFRLVVSGLCDSAALNLVLLSDCEKVFLPSFIGGVVHSVAITVNSRELDNSEGEISLRHRAFNKLNKSLYKYFLELDINEDKINKASKGDDVFLSRQEIINAVKFKSKNSVVFEY
jgi:ATP-dependent protease ClpP protease subunit